MKESIHKKEDKHSGCLICGRPIIYSSQSAALTCGICGNVFEANTVCEENHYICDKCHTSEQKYFLALLRGTNEKNPLTLFRQAAALPGVHMHGPEHHSLVPCIMITAYRNNGGDINFDEALKAAVERGGQVPGGICGFWGACGAAISAGIYASILLGSNPLNGKVWDIPQRLTARCLLQIAEIGGPRCCKRSSRIAIETAAEFTKEYFGIEMPLEACACDYYNENKECLHDRCPY